MELFGRHGLRITYAQILSQIRRFIFAATASMCFTITMFILDRPNSRLVECFSVNVADMSIPTAVSESGIQASYLELFPCPESLVLQRTMTDSPCLWNSEQSRSYLRRLLNKAFDTTAIIPVTWRDMTLPRALMTLLCYADLHPLDQVIRHQLWSLLRPTTHARKHSRR